MRAGQRITSLCAALLIAACGCSLPRALAPNPAATLGSCKPVQLQSPDDDEDETDSNPGPVSGSTELRGPALEDGNLEVPRLQESPLAGGAEGRADVQKNESSSAERADREYPTPDLLNRLLSLEESPIRLSGWFQNSYNADFSYPADGSSFGITPNSSSNRWLFEQLYFILENPLEQNDQFNMGFRVDNLFGSDWQQFHLKGFFDHAFAPGTFGYQLTQAYGQVYFPNVPGESLSILGGLFYSLAGFEDGPAVGRPLLSGSYLFSYAHPYMHIGVLSSWKLTENFTWYNGVVNGWDQWVYSRSPWSYHGGFDWDFNHEKTNLAFSVNAGPRWFFPGYEAIVHATPSGQVALPVFPRGTTGTPAINSPTTLLTWVLTHEWTDRLTMVVETDQGWQSGVPGTSLNGGARTASFYGLAGWLLYHFTDTVTGVWRGEVYRDNNGVTTGFADTFFESTVGAIWKPCRYLWIRPEARYDWSTATHPYDSGHAWSQFTLGFDAIFLF